jgi:hypothetical protein
MSQKPSAAERRKKRKERLLKTSQSYEQELSKLVINWANAESWLVNVLAAILRIKREKADVTFYAIGSNRGRADLIHRVALMYLKSNRDLRHLQKLLRSFRAVTKIRNNVCHAEYNPDGSQSAVTHLFSTTYARSDFDGTNYVSVRAIDDGFVNEVRQARRKAVSLCGSFERFVKKKPAVLSGPRATPPQLTKRRKRRL